MTGQSTSRKPAGLARVLPIVDWLPRYQGGWLRPDLIAGFTVAALVVSKALGYAGIAVAFPNGSSRAVGFSFT